MENEKKSREMLEIYIKELENKVYRALRTEQINKTLFDIANALNTTETMQELYRSIHRILSNLMDMTNFYIAIYHPRRNAIRFVYHVDTCDPTLKYVKWIENFTQDHSLTGDVILAGKPLLLREEELKKLDEQGRVKGIPAKAWIGIPLKINNQVMGVMAVQSYTDPDAFSQSDVDVLSFVSDQIAFSIEKRRAQENLQKAQEKLILNEKLEAIGTLAGGIAHDFNNTLSITLGNINLAQMMISDPELMTILDDAETSVIQAKELASKFVVFSKGGIVLKEKIQTKTFITEMVCAISDQEGIPYRLEVGHIPQKVQVNVSQIKEAVKNVMINAYEAMDKQGKVDVVFKMHGRKSDYVRLIIRDKGKGIEKERIEKVFEPYFSTKPLGKNKGIGLGMTVAHSIIKNHGGEIIIDSEAGKGTSVEILLPVFDRDFEDTGEYTYIKERKEPDTPGKQVFTSSKKAPKETGGKDEPVKILVMDDDPMILDMSSKILDRLGYEPLPAKNGEDAVALYKEHLDHQNPIMAVILDLEIKQGMGGVKTIKELMIIDPEVKAIIASGYSSDRIMENYEAYGFKMAISKPYSMKALEKFLEDLIAPVTF